MPATTPESVLEQVKQANLLYIMQCRAGFYGCSEPRTPAQYQFWFERELKTLNPEHCTPGFYEALTWAYNSLRSMGVESNPACENNTPLIALVLQDAEEHLGALASARYQALCTNQTEPKTPSEFLGWLNHMGVSTAQSWMSDSGRTSYTAEEIEGLCQEGGRYLAYASLLEALGVVETPLPQLQEAAA